MGWNFLFEVQKYAQILQETRKNINIDALDVLVVHFLQKLDDWLLRPLQILFLTQPQEINLRHIGLFLKVIFLDHFGACVLGEDFFNEVDVFP